MELSETAMKPETCGQMKNTLGPADPMDAFPRANVKMRQNNMSVYSISASITSPEGEIPVWLMFHSGHRVYPVKKTTQDIKRIIRWGRRNGDSYSHAHVGLQRHAHN
ncbi:Uncharacterised protein [uncultured archaeon]|nr:Uncharacterised protein [uncultured archaeon]